MAWRVSENEPQRITTMSKINNKLHQHLINPLVESHKFTKDPFPFVLYYCTCSLAHVEWFLVLPMIGSRSDDNLSFLIG